MTYENLLKFIAEMLQKEGIEVEDVDKRGYIRFRIRTKNGDVRKGYEKYIWFVVTDLTAEKIRMFARDTAHEDREKEIVFIGSVEQNADLVAKNYRISIADPKEFFEWIGRRVVEKILSLEETLEKVDENTLKKLLFESDENMDLEKEIENLLSVKLAESENAEDSIPIYLDESVEEDNNSQLKYPIIKPSLLERNMVFSIFKKYIENSMESDEKKTEYLKAVSENSISLELVPYYVYSFNVDVYYENDSSHRNFQGFIIVNSLDGSGRILKESLLTVEELPGVKIKYRPKLNEQQAYHQALELIRGEFSREEEIRKDMDSVTVFEKVKSYPKKIQLHLDSILYYPIWKIRVGEKEFSIDGITKQLLVI